MFEITFAASLITGFFRGGSLDRLAKLPFKYAYLAIGALVIQVGLALTSNWIAVPRLAGFLLLTFSYLILLSALFLNRKQFFLQIILVGVLLNFLVIALNAGMPVSQKSARLIGVNEAKFKQSIKSDYKHVLVSEKTNLNFLGDVIPLPPPYPMPALYSLGDVFMCIGLFLYIQAHLAYKGKRAKEKGHEPLLN